MKRAWILVGAGLVIGACETTSRSERVEFGGTARPTEISAPTSSCDDWRPTRRMMPGLSSTLANFMFADRGDFDNRERNIPVTMSYSILPDGTTANIRFMEPLSYLRHSAYREAPRLTGEALSEWRFEFIGEGEPRPAEDCDFYYEFKFVARS